MSLTTDWPGLTLPSPSREGLNNVERQNPSPGRLRGGPADVRAGGNASTSARNSKRPGGSPGANSSRAICPAIAKSATRSRPWPACTRASSGPRTSATCVWRPCGMMRILRHFRPRLIGSTLTGHVRHGSDIDLHLFSDSLEAVAAAAGRRGGLYEVERKQVRKHGEERVFVHIHVDDRFPFELTIYAGDKAHYVFKSSITGKAIERASIAELEQLLGPRVPRRIAGAGGAGGREPGRSLPDLRDAAVAAGERQGEPRTIIPRATPSTTAFRSSTWPGPSCPTTRSSCWPPCCTTWARRSTGSDHVAAGLGVARGLHHAADRLADRAPHGRRRCCWTAS